MLFEIGVISGLATQEPRLDYSRWRNNCSWFFVALRKTGVMEEVERLIATTGLDVAGRLKGTNGFSKATMGEAETPKHPSEGFEQPLDTTGTQGTTIGWVTVG